MEPGKREEPCEHCGERYTHEESCPKYKRPLYDIWVEVQEASEPVLKVP